MCSKFYCTCCGSQVSSLAEGSPSGTEFFISQETDHAEELSGVGFLSHKSILLYKYFKTASDNYL